MTDLFIHITIRAGATNTAITAITAMAILFFEGKNGITGILTFTRVATSKVSPLRLRAYKAVTRGPTFSVFSPVLVSSHINIHRLGMRSTHPEWRQD